VMLAAGAQPSDYFKCIFGAAATVDEGTSHTSRLSLADSAADAFPAFLDFSYTGQLAADSASATALMHLASSLQCRKLHAAVASFMQDDLVPSTAAFYLTEAERFSLDKVSAAALPLCSAALDTEALELVLKLPPALFQRVVQAEERGCSSEALSAVVAQYCRGAHADKIDGPFLASVTSADLMPEVKPAEALALLELAVKHPHDGDSKLRARCVAACAVDWRDVLLPSIEARAIPEAEKVAILASALRAAEAELVEVKNELHQFKPPWRCEAEAK